MLLEMPRWVQITLAVPIVQPLVDRLREEVYRLGKSPPMLPEEKNQTRTNMSEVESLLSLFHPDFSNTGLITVTQHECPAVLRACSFLRLQFRHGSMSAITDETLESGLAADHLVGGDRDDFLSYTFLGTLQLVLLKDLKLPSRSGGGWTEWCSRLWHVFRPSEKAPLWADSGTAAPTESWQVVVLNDPVNLMDYVTAVFRDVFLLPEEVAQKHMREVHELKSSKVWVGPRNKAEVYVQALRSWHLQAVLRRCEDA